MLTGWPIGPVDGSIRCAVDASGALHANSVRVSGADGWVTVELAAGRDPIELRIELAPTLDGPTFYAREIRAEGRTYASPGELLMFCVRHGSAALHAALHAAIARRVAAASSCPPSRAA